MELPKFMDYGGWRVQVLRRGHFPDTVIILFQGAEIEVNLKDLKSC